MNEWSQAISRGYGKLNKAAYVFIQVVLNLVVVGVGPVVSEGHRLRHGQLNAGASAALHGQCAKVLHDGLLLVRIHHQPVLDVHRAHHLFVAGGTRPIALLVGVHLFLVEDDLFGR